MMKKAWSGKWAGSSQPRKQRKYRLNAPLHARRRFLSVNLSSPLRERFAKRSMPVRKGDEVVIKRGRLRGKSGPVEKVSLGSGKVYIEGIKVKKVDGSEVPLSLEPSNLQITRLKLEDKRRQAVLERAESPAGKKEKGE
jgi:large subunit ribosomal protein L24